MYICRGKGCSFVLKKVECGLRYRGYFTNVVVNRGFWGIVFATELQCAADGGCSAVDVCAVIECEDAGGGVVCEGMSRAVNTDGAGVCRAVVLPEK